MIRHPSADAAFKRLVRDRDRLFPLAQIGTPFDKFDPADFARRVDELTARRPGFAEKVDAVCTPGVLEQAMRRAGLIGPRE